MVKFVSKGLVASALVLAASGIVAENRNCEEVRDLIDVMRETLDEPPHFETDWDDAYMRTYERMRHRRTIESELQRLADQIEDCC